MEGKFAGAQNVCLDASIIVKLLTRERDSARAAGLFNQLVKESSEIFEPLFLRMEVYSTLRKKSYLKELSAQRVKTALKFFKELPLDYATEDEDLLDSSLELAEKLSIPVIYDCLYLALAKQRKALFISADKKFVKKAKEVYRNSFSLSEVSPIQY